MADGVSTGLGVQMSLRPPKALSSSQHARWERILKAAVQLLIERDYEQIQMRQVAEASEVALATLYRYFPSKEQLYASAMVAWGDSFDTKVRAQSRTANTDAARLRSALHRTIKAYERSPNFYRLTATLEVAADPAAREVFYSYTERFFRLLADVLEDTNEQDAKTAVLVSVSVLGALLRRWSLGELPVRRVYEQIDETVSLIFGQPRQRTSKVTPAASAR